MDTSNKETDMYNAIDLKEAQALTDAGIIYEVYNDLALVPTHKGDDVENDKVFMLFMENKISGYSTVSKL